MRRTPLFALPLLALACGSPADRPGCSTDADCAPGTRCQPTSGGGVCWPGNTIGLEAPAAQATVGLAGSAATATLVLGKPGSTAPASVDLLADGIPVATLLPGPGSSSAVAYSGRYQPPAGTDRPVALVARATVDGEAIASPPVTVTVDAAPPGLAILGASCPPRALDCERDGLLLVRAAVTGPDVASVTATLDLDPARTLALAPRGAEHQAQVRLGDYPFPGFGRVVQVRVTAEDAAGNRTTQAQAVTVTRLRWGEPAEAGSVVPLTGAAIDAAGNAVVGGGNGKLYVYAPDGQVLRSPAVGGGSIAAAPSIGPTAIWVASQDGRIYAVDGTGAVLNGSGCATSSVPVGTPALSAGSPELSFTGTTTAKALFAARATGPLCYPTPAGDGFVSSVAVGAGQKILAATATSTNAVNVHRFSDTGAGLTHDWSVGAGAGGEAPLALDGSGRVLLISADGTLYRVTDEGTQGSAAAVAAVSGRALESVLVLAGGDVVVGAVGGKVHRLAEGGGAVWAAPPDLGADVTGLVAAAPGGAQDPVLYAVTVLGDLVALRADGGVVWSHPVAAGALRFPAIAPARAGGLPTLYAGSADGRLYAVVVDTGLDGAAPWPKAHHDLRNTGNLASPLP